MNKKLSKKDKTILISLIAAMIVVIVVGTIIIVSNVAGANKEAEKLREKASGAEITSSQTSSGKASGSKATSSAPTKSDKNSSKISSDKKSSAASSKAGSVTSSSKTSNTSSATKSKASSKTGSKTSSKSSVKGDKINRITPEHTSSHATEKILKVNGKECHVGDTITVVLNLQSNKSIVNYQGYTSIDSKYLKVKEVTPNGMGIVNNESGTITYNASVINGMDFSETGSIYSVTLEVLTEGSTKITNDLEIISELGSDYLPKQLEDSDYTTKLEIYN